MARKRGRRVTVGRALALLLVGMALGVAIFLAKHLRPEEIERRVKGALAQIFAGRFQFRKAELNLDKGIEIYDLEVRYPEDDAVALGARRLSVTIDHRALLRGSLVVRQIELSGAVVRLRTGPDDVLGLPGILRPGQPAATSRAADRAMPFPILVRRTVEEPSRLFVEGWPTRAESVPLEMRCRHLELIPDGRHYDLTAEFTGPRVDRVELDATLDTVARLVRLSRVRVRGLSWDPEHTSALAQLLPDEQRPPIVLAGKADLTMNRPLVLRRVEDLLNIDASATLRALNGKFGNLHTFRAHGMPFHLSSGRCDVVFRDRRVRISNLGAIFAGREGDAGKVLASYERDFGRPGLWQDWTLEGRDIFASPHHLAILLPVDIAKKVVGPFAPGGTFDFEVSVSNRIGSPEKVHADVRMRNARFEYHRFRYPVDSCAVRLQVETNVSKPHGLCDVIRFQLDRGPDIWKNPALVAADVMSVRAEGEIESYLPAEEGGENPEIHDIDIRIANIAFDERLEHALDSAGVRDDTYHSFRLGGRADRVVARIIQDDFGDRPSRETYAITLRDCTAAYDAFPLPVEGLSGTIIRRINPPISKETGEPLPELQFDNLRARVREGGDLTAHAALSGDDLEVIVQCKGLVLGKDMERTLQTMAGADPAVIELWRRVQPSGAVDAELHFDSREKDKLTVWIDLAGRFGIAGYGAFDCPITGIDGTIFYKRNRLELSGITGRVGDAQVTLDGFHESEEGIFNLYGVIAGAVRNDLLVQINELSGKDWIPDDFELKRGSRVRYEVWSSRTAPDSDPLTRVELTDLALRGPVFGMPLRLDGGKIRIGETAVTFGGMRIAHEPSGAWIDVVRGRFPIEEEAGPPVFDVRAERIHPSEHVTPFLGEGVAELLGPDILIDLPLMGVEYRAKDDTYIFTGTVDLHRGNGPESEDGLGPTGILVLKKLELQPTPPRGGPPRLKGAIRFSELNIRAGWSPTDMGGVLHIDDCRLAKNLILRGRVSDAEGDILDFHADEVELDLDFELQNLRFTRIDGNFHGGRLRGEVSVHTTDPGAYDVDIEASRVDLHDMLEKYIGRDDPIGGVLDFTIRLHNLSGEVTDQKGDISVNITEGQLIEVPGIRKFISLLSRATPFDDKGARFEKAVADIRVRGEQLFVDRLHFSTATNDIHIDGRVSLYGDLDLVVKPQVTRLIDLPRLIDIPVLSAIRNLWHKIAYEIRLEGTIDSPALRLHGLPWLRKARPPAIQSPHAGRVRRMRPRVLP